MSEDSLRVALLARSGEACDRIGEALREAGAELVLVADPAVAEESAVREARPQAIMVALEPSIEDALERFDPLLADPQYLVIFEEAELAAQRAGWDAARWVRHLSAKLHRHDDVLPPGAEDAEDLQPSPGPLPPRVLEVDYEEAIAAFADEAQQLAEEVPRDSGIEGPVAAVPAPADTAASSPFDPVAFEVAEMSFSGTQDTPLTMGTGDAPALIDDPFVIPADDDADAVTPSPETAATGAETKTWSDGGLSLVLDDTPLPTATRSDPAVPALDELESRISGLSLVDVDSYGHGPERGAVLVEAGLGGPDAVRQLLAAVPGEFPRPILVRLQLDGGRYDRLVKQMERVSVLPVLLAENGALVEPGQVYFLPPALGLQRDRGELRFEEEGAPAGETLPAALPPADSAVLLLSGASRRIADAALGGDWTVALVAGQSPEGSYDPDAALALLERGGTAGTPAELAAMLVERWMPHLASDPGLEDPLA